jgi:hypothetical protein
MRRTPWIAAGCLLALTLSGCATDDEMRHPDWTSRTVEVVTRGAADLPTLPTGRSSYAAGRPATVAGGDIHIGRTTIDVAPLRADAAYATRGGTFFLNGSELWFTDGERARATGFTHVNAVVASDDGRYLGLVDRNHGPSVPGGADLASAVVYDTTTGTPLLRSYAGMGRLRDDLRALYRATPPRVTGFLDHALEVRTPDGTWRYPLDGARPRRVD